ncbi:MAG: hypothetical protein M3082_22645 [Candidatus Dormibacteraeota bacterium]|nr:hypothetical protein [Candidatus Dormibacteraeota bacterium]
MAKKMSSDIVVRLNCLPGWRPLARSTFTTTFITAHPASRMSTVPRASALVTVVTLFNTASTIKNSHLKLTATRSPTRRRSASNLSSIARALMSCQRRGSALPGRDLTALALIAGSFGTGFPASGPPRDHWDRTVR